MKTLILVLGIFCALATLPVTAEECSKLNDSAQRLSCYDKGNRAKPKAKACSAFESKSNVLLKFFKEGFKLDEFRPKLVDLETEYESCKKESIAAERLAVYETNMSAFQAVYELWNAGLRDCEGAARLTGLQCDWYTRNSQRMFIKPVVAKNPILERVINPADQGGFGERYGVIANKTLGLVTKF